MSTPKIEIVPLKQGFLRAAASPAYALVRIVAPSAPVDAVQPIRPPLDLALVIDRSGSMSGRPLEAAIEASVRIINGLKSGDRISVVTFDDSVDVISPLVEPGNRDELVRRVRAIQSGGSTALFDGWREGVNRLLPHVDKGRISRVILLSDGQANHGLTDQDQIFQQVARVAGEGITTSTVGLGHGFNEALLSGMAHAGEGAANFGKTADDLDEAFEEQFAILSNTYLRQVRVSVTGGSDVKARLVGERLEAGSGSVRNLGTLAWDSSLVAVIEFTAGIGAKPDALAAINFDARNKDGEAVAFGPVIVAIPEVDLATYSRLPESSDVRAAVSEAVLSERIEAAEAMVREGRDVEARKLLEAFLAEPGLSDYARNKLQFLLERLQDDRIYAMKEMRYGRNAMVRKLRGTHLGEFSSTHDEALEVNKQIYTRKKKAEGQSSRPPSPDKQP